MEGVDPINKQRLGPILWRERYLILISIVVMVALSIVYTLTSAKVYQASAILEVNLTTSNPGSADTTNANQGLAQNYATLLVSTGFLRQIRPQVDHGQLSVDSLQSRLTATALPSSALVELKANGSSPQQAQSIAQQVTTAFLNNLQHTAATRTQQLQNELQNQIASLTSQIAALDNSNSSSAAEQIKSLTASRQALINQIGTLVTNGLAQGASASLSSFPAASSTPISPRKSLNVIAGLLLGALLGVALAWARQALRPAIHSADDVTSLLNIPLLASIPLQSPYDPNDPALQESYGVLHANLTFALRAGDLRIVTVVGYNPEVGKTSVVDGLGRAAARRDRRVLLVDGDMRAATLSARHGYHNMPGLVDVLQGAIPLDVALIDLGNGLHLLPTRRSRVNAASLLASNRTFALMSELRERFDVVILDSPPLSGLADGLLLASQSDLVVLVTRVGLTKPRDLTRATNGLMQNMTPLAGTVVFEEVPVMPYYGGPEPAPSPKPRTRALSH